MAKNNNEDEKITLRSFLIKEHKLITSLGVFITLTIFTKSFLTGNFSTFVTLLFLFLAFLIFFELWEQFPKNNGSTKLSLFEAYLSIGSLLVLLFWLLELKELEIGGHLIVITLFLYGPIMTLLSNQIIKRFNIFNRIFNTKNNEKKIIRYAFGYITIVLSFVVVFMVVYYFKDYINQILDAINHS